LIPDNPYLSLEEFLYWCREDCGFIGWGADVAWLKGWLGAGGTIPDPHFVSGAFV